LKRTTRYGKICGRETNKQTKKGVWGRQRQHSALAQGGIREEVRDSASDHHSPPPPLPHTHPSRRHHFAFFPLSFLFVAIASIASEVLSGTMSATPSKRGGAKPKGAVRAKSGCYTCRIRRKVRIPLVCATSFRLLILVIHRNATSSPTKRATVRRASVSGFSASASEPKGPSG
jgi:hypothetical protein